MSVLDSIKQAMLENRLENSHYFLARYISRSVPGATEFCLCLCVLVNREIARGNVCLLVDQIGEGLVELGVQGMTSIDVLMQRVSSSPVVGQAFESRPLIIDGHRLYLNRFFHYETGIVKVLQEIAARRRELSLDDLAVANALFPADQSPDYQKLAAIVSCRHSLAIISGGPGTGKTWTVARILQLIHKQVPGIRISLAAPTGKAAARLSSSIQSIQHSEGSSLHFDEAVTLHRLLGIHRFTHRPKYHSRNRLACGVLVVDEASMIDQQMMAMLCAALPDNGRLILLGDKDQLSSVEAGSVFADLCGGLTKTQFSAAQNRWLAEVGQTPVDDCVAPYRLSDHVIVLEKSHRFSQNSSIGRLAACINRGDMAQSMKLLRQENDSLLRWLPSRAQDLHQRLQAEGITRYLLQFQENSIQAAFERYQSFRMLSPVWDGPAGVNTINRIIDITIKKKLGLDAESEYYPGKPVIMNRNLYQYDIFNGDIALLWPDEDGELSAWFEIEPGRYRCLALSQLPQHEAAFAMTVHKSQGSEFEHVLVVLPDIDTPVLTRELLYTAVTRTSGSLEIWANEDIIQHCIERQTLRVSGLLDRLTSS